MSFRFAAVSLSLDGSPAIDRTLRSSSGCTPRLPFGYQCSAWVESALKKSKKPAPRNHFLKWALQEVRRAKWGLARITVAFYWAFRPPVGISYVKR
jgi:hypothetical protein